MNPSPFATRPASRPRPIPTSCRLLPIAALLAASTLALLPGESAAVPAADTVFPSQTVAFFSIPKPAEFEEKWEMTQIGQFAADPSMKPFVDQIRDKLISKFGNIKQRLGITLQDVTDAATGEIGVGMLHSEGSKASVAAVIDVSETAAQADALVAKAEQDLVKQGAVKSSETFAGTQLAIFTLPKNEDLRFSNRVVHFRRGKLLCAVDNIAFAKQIITAIDGQDAQTLSDLKGYQETMQRCQKSAKGLAPDLRWYISPFAWDAARRTLEARGVVVDRKDTATILREQGFDAVKAIGGYISMAVSPEQDFIHRTAVYAPPTPGTEGKSAREKYRLGMRMAELPNRPDMPIEQWAPRMTATYTTINVDILNAFDHVDTLFDAMSGYDGAFRTTLDSFEVDPYGPKIKVREQLVKNLGKRLTMMTDYKLPITPTCERYLFVVEVTNPDLLRSPIDKLMENDGALNKQVNNIQYWEIVPEEEMVTSADLGDDLLSIDDTGFDDEIAEKPERRERVLRRAAVCLHEKQLIIASDVEFLRQVLFGIDQHESLGESLDFQTTMLHLEDIADRNRCSWSFFRTDESVRPSYELIRQGLMPQSQTFFGRLLNRMLTTPEDEEMGIVRKQRIDGSRLPSFELARRYFGPAARAIRTDEDGWLISGVILSKNGQ